MSLYTSCRDGDTEGNGRANGTRIRPADERMGREEGGEDSAVAGRRLGPSEIDASLGSSLIYAFITVNNASPFTSGLSRVRSLLPTPTTLPISSPSFISQSYAERECHSVARAKRSSLLKAPFPRCILKRLGAVSPPSDDPCVYGLPPSPSSLHRASYPRLNPRAFPSPLSLLRSNKY